MHRPLKTFEMFWTVQGSKSNSLGWWKVLCEEVYRNHIVVLIETHCVLVSNTSESAMILELSGTYLGLMALSIILNGSNRYCTEISKNFCISWYSLPINHFEKMFGPMASTVICILFVNWKKSMEVWISARTDVLDSINHDLKYAQYNACPKKFAVNQYVHLSSKCATFFLMHAYHFIFVDLLKSDCLSWWCSTHFNWLNNYCSHTGQLITRAIAS